MADNVDVTPGAGASIATDDVGGIQFQKVKLDLGGDGLSAPWVGKAENPTADDVGAVTRPAPLKVHACSFADVGSGLLTPDMVQIGSTGTGITVAQSAGNLTIATGTTANAEFLARSVFSAEGAHVMRWGMVASQRIAQNNLAIMLADLLGTGLSYSIVSTVLVDVTLTAHGLTATAVGRAMFLGALSSVGTPGRFVIQSIPDANTIRFTVVAWPASGSGTLCLFGWNYHRVLYTSTTATNAAYDAQRNGWASGDTTATISTSASPGHIGHMQSDCVDTAFSDSLRASNTAYQFTTRATRVENMPDQDVTLYAFVWSYNGSSAPATTTTWTINFLRLEDLANHKVYLAGMTRGGVGNSLATSVIGTVPVSGTVTATVSTTTNIPSTGQGSSSTFRQAQVANITTGAPTAARGAVTAVGSIEVANNCGAGVWFHLYNKATAPTLGTDTPVDSFFCPTGTTTPIPCGPWGRRFSTGVAYAIVDNCAAIPVVGGTITIASTATAICVTIRYT